MQWVSMQILSGSLSVMQVSTGSSSRENQTPLLYRSTGKSLPNLPAIALVARLPAGPWIIVSVYPPRMLVSKRDTNSVIERRLVVRATLKQNRRALTDAPVISFRKVRSFSLSCQRPRRATG